MFERKEVIAMADTNLANWLEAMWRHYNEIVDRLDKIAQALDSLRDDVKSLDQKLEQNNSDN
jgi:hypothetical protein